MVKRYNNNPVKVDVTPLCLAIFTFIVQLDLHELSAF